MSITMRLLCCLSILLFQSTAIANTADNLQLIQLLKDDSNNIDGLGNPRRIEVSSDNQKVYITSGDDNAFAVFNADNNFRLTLGKVFKNSTGGISGLEGASGVVVLEKTKQVVVTGFYDGALTRFTDKHNGFNFTEVVSDGLSYEEVFDSDKSVAKLDHLGILGAWDVVKTNDEQQLFVAGYMSNAVAIFDIQKDGSMVFNKKLTVANPLKSNLGKPISLALSPDQTALYVLGFDENQLTVFARDNKGSLTAKQVIIDDVNGVKQFVNPQSIVVSPDGKFLYIACAGTSSLVVFQKLANGTLEFLQSITNKSIDDIGLAGASTLAIDPLGTTIYAAGESGHGLYIFDVGADGKLSFDSKMTHVAGTELKTISSITITPNNKHLLVATGKENSLFVFKINQ
ncbi:beta-propeller fold lactonase family protein [Thalassotalea marina]|uniref:beta-propeller fold lactonase family protein n=1 Tax=Thalassotalea marina TaxID=1673741 RepID=UPI0016719DAB|nr:beta-propeller fold lactonase family protein [Thalassotalea marina]